MNRIKSAIYDCVERLQNKVDSSNYQQDACKLYLSCGLFEKLFYFYLGNDKPFPKDENNFIAVIWNTNLYIDANLSKDEIVVIGSNKQYKGNFLELLLEDNKLSLEETLQLLKIKNELTM